jgi:hypothetical protein
VPTRLLEYEGTWEELVARAPEFQGRRVRLLVILDDDDTRASIVAPAARLLLKMPPEKRDRILREQAALMEKEYRTDSQLTDFEAFGPNDLIDEYPDNVADP